MNMDLFLSGFLGAIWVNHRCVADRSGHTAASVGRDATKDNHHGFTVDARTMLGDRRGVLGPVPAIPRWWP
jgi:hypothetical protein